MAGRRSEGLTTRRPGTPQDLAIITKSGYTSFSSLEVWYSPSCVRAIHQVCTG